MRRRCLWRLSLFVFIICPFVFFVACEPVDKILSFFSDDGTGYIFKFAISKTPENLDPQLANDRESVMIAKNLFAGLFEYGEDGELVGRISQRYEVSDDGLCYTFYLKEGYSWYATGGFTEPVTANDFVFAFRRLMDPRTASPHSEKYFCIKGAKNARLNNASLDEIGVVAIDDYTLQFTLEYQNAEFLYLLAELPAMPCCEKFFNEKAGGKYGLEAEATCSNGPFYIRFWQYDPYGTDNFVRLRRNPEYSKVSYVSPSGINYLVNPDFSDRRSDFDDGTTDVCLFLPYQAPNTESGSASGFADTVGIIFNEKNAAFSEPEIRQIISWAIDREALKNEAPEILQPAKGIIPNDPRIIARGYSPKLPDDVSVTDLSLAEYRWSFILSERRKSELIGMTLMVPSDFEYGYALSKLSDSWYNALGIHFNIETVNARDYEARLNSGDYDMALVCVSSDTGSMLDYIEPFGEGSRFGIKSPESVESALSGRGRYASSDALSSACSLAEADILGEYHFLPLWHLPTVCAFDGDIEGLSIDPFSKTVYFEDAKKF